MKYQVSSTMSCLFAVLLGAGAIGCGSSQPPPDTGPGSGNSGTHSGPACELEVVIQCGPGFVDGCLVQHAPSSSGALTTHHVCVAQDERNDIPCAQEIARQCPPGQMDACLLTPAASEFHVCVVPGGSVEGGGSGNPSGGVGGNPPEEAFCGSSTQAACEEDADCRRGGCSAQVCESATAEPSMTTCDYRACYNPDAYNLTCGCVNNQCAWN